MEDNNAQFVMISCKRLRIPVVPVNAFNAFEAICRVSATAILKSWFTDSIRIILFISITSYTNRTVSRYVIHNP